MKPKLQTTAICLLILSFSIFGCGPAGLLLATPANPNLPPAQQTTEAQTGRPQPSEIISSDNAKNIVELTSWGKGSGHHPTYSPDGKLLAVSSLSGIYLYDSRTLKENLHFGTEILEMAFSTDGKTLSTVEDNGSDYAVAQWDVVSGSQLHTWRVGSSNYYPNINALSSDGKTAAISVDDNTVKVSDVASGKVLHSLSVSSLTDLAFSPNGKILASAETSKVTLWDVASGSKHRTIVTGRDLINPDVISVAFSADGRTLATGSKPALPGGTNRGTVQLWDVASGSQMHGFNQDTAVTLVFSSDGKTLATTSSDAIKLWDSASGKQLLSWNASNLESLAFSPDGNTLVSASSVGDDSVQLWNTTTGNLLGTVKGDDVSGKVIFSPDSRTLAYLSSDFSVKLRDVASGEVRSLSGHPGAVQSVAFSPDSRVLASGSYGSFYAVGNNVLKLWDVASGRELHTINWDTTAVYTVAFSPDSKTLAAGGGETIKLWDVASGKELANLSGHKGLVFSVAYSPDGKTLASASDDKTIKLWDAASGAEVRTLSGHTNAVTGLAFSPDGKVLASGSGDKTIKVWDVASGSELHTFSGYGYLYPISSLDFSPDGKSLASNSYDVSRNPVVNLWDVASGQEKHPFNGDPGLIFSVAFSPDGRILASGGDATIKLWDVASGKELANLSGDINAVVSLAFSPDGKLILSSSNMNSLWGVSP